MDNIIIKVIKGESISKDELVSGNIPLNEFTYSLARNECPDQQDLYNALYEVCDNVHASCNPECPVYRLMNKKEREASECPFHKDGEGMYNFIKKKLGIK